MIKQRGICIDFCETLTPELTIRWADRHLLNEAGHAEMSGMRDRLLPKLVDGTITRHEMENWSARTFDIYAELGVTKAQIAQAMKGFPLREGTRELLEHAKNEKIPVAIVSGSCADFIDIALESAGLTHLVTEIYSARITYDGERVTGVRRSTIVTNFNKGDCTRQFANRHGIPESGIVGIGDSRNDDLLAGPNGYLIGIVANEQRASRIRERFHEVHITDSLHLVTDSIRRRYS